MDVGLCMIIWMDLIEGILFILCLFGIFVSALYFGFYSIVLFSIWQPCIWAD